MGMVNGRWSRVLLLPVAFWLGGCSVVKYGGGSTVGDAGAAPASLPSHQPTPWTEIGRSVEDRPIRMRTIGDGPRRVIWIGGIHGDEPEGEVATEELPAAFANRSGLGDRVSLTLIEDVNPDGRVARTRGNSRGVDLNRNYPAANYQPSDTSGPVPLSEPEARALHDLIVARDPHLVIVAHSWGRKPEGPTCFVNFDGPAGHLAELFSSISGYPVKASTELHGTPGSLGSFVGIDRRTPILTLEYERGRSPLVCWDETREAILAVIEGGPTPAPSR